jgi:hypothetical protein
MVELGLKAKR